MALPVVLVREKMQPDLVQSWLQRCEQGHSETCSKSTGWLREIAGSEELGIILIDVKGRRLVKATTASRYLALSYVWGQTPTTQTTLSNFVAFQKLEALEEIKVSLPRTIRDAMKLVADIGETYLWTDLLCIIQDDPSKADQIKAMDLIYSNSILTIVALAGPNADFGLPGVNGGHYIERSDIAVEDSLTDGKIIVPSRPLFEQMLKSHHYTRGWTMQEMILSPRCLFIAEDRTYFKCKGMLAVEGEKIRSREEHYFDGDLDSVVGLLKPTSKAVFINSYETLVEQYTQRSLTFESDIVNAFSGIMSALTKLYPLQTLNSSPERFIDTLPRAFLSRALLWTSIEETTSRRVINQEIFAESPRFPSWSWSGWTGPVSYDVVGLWKLSDMQSINNLLLHIWYRDDLLAVKGRHLVLWSDITGEKDLPPKGHSPCSIILGDEIPRASLLERKVCGEKINSATGPIPIQMLFPLLEFQASTVPAQLFTFGMRRLMAYTSLASSGYREEESKLKRESSMRFLPIMDREARQCGGFFNPNFKTVLEAEQASLLFIALSYFKGSKWVEGIFGDYYKGNWRGADTAKGCGCVLNVMLLKQDGDLFERVAIAQVHPEAWSSADPVWKTVVLV